MKFGPSDFIVHVLFGFACNLHLSVTRNLSQNNRTRHSTIGLIFKSHILNVNALSSCLKMHLAPQKPWLVHNGLVFSIYADKYWASGLARLRREAMSQEWGTLSTLLASRFSCLSLAWGLSHSHILNKCPLRSQQLEEFTGTSLLQPFT